MSRPHIALLFATAGMIALMASVSPVHHEPSPRGPVAETFVEDPPVPTASDGDPPPPLPGRAVARLGPIAGAYPDGELVFSPDGKYLVVGIKSGLQIWDVRKEKLVRTMSDVWKPRFSPDGKTLAALRSLGLGDVNDLILWNFASGKELRRYRITRAMYYLSFADDGRSMYVGGDPIERLDLKTGRLTPLFDRENQTEQFWRFSQYPFTPAHLDFSPKTMTVASAHWRRRPFLFHCGTDRPGNVLPVEMPNNADVRLSPDGKVVATMGGAPLHLFDAETAKPLPAPATSYVDKCVFSPDGKRIAWFGAHDRQIHLFDVATGKQAPPLQEPIAHFENLVFSPDGATIASTLTDGTIVLWDPNAAPSDRDPPRAFRAQRRIPVPGGAKVTITTDKRQYVLGERIDVHFAMQNVGNTSFHYSTGGDYRGADRHLRYYVEAVHEDGEAMPDPNPDQRWFGGLGSEGMMAPGSKHTTTLDLLAYRQIDRPGKYRIRASHGYGWDATDDRPNPSGETTVEVLAPTPEQARKLVDEIDARNKPRDDGKDEPHAIRDYARLTTPIYLPLMAERARAGSYSALLALGETPDPRATKVLVELLDHPDPKFVHKVEESLYLRMPDPILDKKLHGRNIFDNDDEHRRTHLRDKSWRTEFAAEVRKHARKCLARRDEAGLFRGAFMLSCVGTAEDLPDLVAAFDFAVKEAQGKPIATDRYPRPPGACGELRRAARISVARGVPVAERPRTSGEKILFVEKSHHDKGYRPKGWETTFVGILTDEMAYVREVALECCPNPLPEAFKRVIPERMRDPHVDVQIAALRLVETNPLPEWKPAVLDVFARAEEEWLRNAVDNAAHHLCDRLELTECYVALLDDPAKARLAVEGLTHILRDGGNKTLGTDIDTPEKRRKCKAAWLKFIAENRGRLKEKGPFSVKDPIPIADLFPGIRFDGPD